MMLNMNQPHSKTLKSDEFDKIYTSPGYASDEGPDCLNMYEYGFIGVLILTLCLSLLAIYLVSAKLIHIVVSTSS